VFNDQTGTFDIVRLNAPAPFTNPVDQVTTTTYDQARSSCDGGESGRCTNGFTLSELRYRYDQFGNRVEIRATYTPQGRRRTTDDKCLN